MKVNWPNFVSRLKSYPDGIHRMLPPCPEESIQAVQANLGKLPTDLADMLRHFNGAKLFCDAMPLVSIFGISTETESQDRGRASDWYIDRFSVSWRSSEPNRNEWAIGMMNYGGLILLNLENIVKEWDTNEKAWSSTEMPFCDWVDELLRQGDAYLSAE